MNTGEMPASKRTYLDHNASAPLLPAAREAMAGVLEMTGNPSSVHAEGRALRAVIEDGREAVALAAGTEAERVIFTGSATEALTQAIVGGVEAGLADAIVVTAGEHQAVLKAAEAARAPVELVGLTADGEIDLTALAALVARADGGRLLIALHSVNNETGVVQPIGAVEEMLADTPHMLVVDAVQGFGKLALGFDAGRADMVAVSAHKIGGPAGIGALLVKPEFDAVRLIPGGGQQQGRRGGTESAALSAGFAEAARSAGTAFDLGKLRPLGDEIEAAIRDRAPGAVIFAAAAERLGTTIDFAIPDLDNATSMIGFDLAGVALSAGSACSSGKVSRSHVLTAMGVPAALADCALRVSVGWSTTEKDVARFAEALDKLIAQHASADTAA
jgi:cysteine desulfurase